MEPENVTVWVCDAPPSIVSEPLPPTAPLTVIAPVELPIEVALASVTPPAYVPVVLLEFVSAPAPLIPVPFKVSVPTVFAIA